jgi:hypothetical protein
LSGLRGDADGAEVAEIDAAAPDGDVGREPQADTHVNRHRQIGAFTQLHNLERAIRGLFIKPVHTDRTGRVFDVIENDDVIAPGITDARRARARRIGVGPNRRS